ncbi:MAG TPA: phage major capsid protein [Candidatus Limnocylindrales bacterium]|nr:phage major capsid protein [Candidatus Limnocylindrales bacterium]
MDARRGDPEANAYIKALLGTSVATGAAVVPNAFVSDISRQVGTLSPWRNIFSVETVSAGSAVDVPYEVTGLTAALVQGAYGSNKDNRDFTLARATATLYTIAQITDVGNQLLRQSNGAAERVVRRRLAASFAMTESAYITNGTGSGQPLGILPAMPAFGDPAGFKTTLTSEPRAATIGRALGALEGRGRQATAVVLNPTDFWELATEGLGTSYAGGWALAPADGPSSGSPQATLWGVRTYRCADLPVGTGLAIDATDGTIWVGDELRIDVSTEAGNRFDQNVTGYRAEEELGFTAEPMVRTGAVQKILGL